jgi:hypothetical protein
MGEWSYSSTILEPRTRCRLVVRFTLYPRYPLDRRLGGSQSRPGRYGEEKNLIAIPTELSRLLAPKRRTQQKLKFYNFCVETPRGKSPKIPVITL